MRNTSLVRIVLLALTVAGAAACSAPGEEGAESSADAQELDLAYRATDALVATLEQSESLQNAGKPVATVEGKRDTWRVFPIVTTDDSDPSRYAVMNGLGVTFQIDSRGVAVALPPETPIEPYVNDFRQGATATGGGVRTQAVGASTLTQQLASAVAPLTSPKIVQTRVVRGKAVKIAAARRTK